MEIVWLNTEVDAIHYVYDYAVPKQIPLDTFEKFVRSSKEGTLQKKITKKSWNLSINSVMQTDGINSLGWLNKKVINCKKVFSS